MKVRLKAEGMELTATLIDSGTTQDFISLLPLTLTMNDLLGREKFAHLPRAFSEGGNGRALMKLGTWPIGLPVPIWRSFIAMAVSQFTSGIIVIGKIGSGVEALNVAGPVISDGWTRQ